MRGYPLVSYILVNWHTEDLLPRALASIAAQDHPRREVIVVDNGSDAFTPALLDACPGVKLLSNARNTGYAHANNQALARASGEFVVLLNCDAYLDPQFTRRALEVMDAGADIGSVVPKILRDDGSGVLDGTGHILYTDRTPAQRGQGERDQGQYDAGGFVFGGTGAAIMYRRAMLQAVAYPWPAQVLAALRAEEEAQKAPGVALEDEPDGIAPVFDEAFFAYYEDVDLDWRANLAGWRAYYEPACVAWHRGHGSGGRGSLKIQLIAEKNRYLMLVKNDTLAGQLGALGPLALYEAWHALRVLGRPWLWPALIMLLWHLPGAWAYRLRAGRSRKTPPREVARLMRQRGLQAPPAPAPPSASDVPLLERPGERRSGEGAQFPLVSAIVLNYNGLALSRQCLQALAAQSYSPLELILVDNGSAVDEAELLAMSTPGLRTLRLPRNHGFAGGVNWGLTLAQGAYVLLINNDTLPDPDCVRRLVYTARQRGAAAVSGRLLDIADPALLPAARAALELEQEVDEAIVWDLPPHLSAALEESWRNHGLSLSGYIVHDVYQARAECFYPSGGLCLLDRAALAPLLPELFPHRYFAYHEDACLGFRLRVRGYGVVKEPRAAAVHLHGSTARRLGRPRLRFLQERNRLLNLLGYLPDWVLRAMLPRLMLENLLVGIALLGRPGDFLGWLAAHAWLSWHLPTLAAWRAQCRGECSVPDAQWLAELSGQVRGRGGVLNRWGLDWCRARGIPCAEDKRGI